MEDNKSIRAEDLSADINSAYYEYKFTASKRYIGIISLIAAVFNLLLLIPDLMFASGTSQLSVIIARVLFSAILFALYIFIKRITELKTFVIIVVVSELLSLIIYLFVFMNYEGPNMLIQAMGLITIFLVIFYIPIRWAYTMIIALLGEAGFLVCALVSSGYATGSEFWAALVYISIAVLLCAITARNSEIHQRREFAAKKDLEHISSTDYLTEAASRYKIMEEAEKWMDFCRRYNLPLSLVFIDVDNLKDINDRYGHLKGDLVLSNLAKTICSQLRSSDILARWGGDEFVLLLPNFSLINATALTERIREAMAKSDVFEGISVTCSLGITSMKEDCSFEDLVREADCLMYSEKQSLRRHMPIGTNRS